MDPKHFENLRIIGKWSNVPRSQPFFLALSQFEDSDYLLGGSVYYRFNISYVKGIGKEHLQPMSYLENSVFVSTEINEALQQD